MPIIAQNWIPLSRENEKKIFLKSVCLLVFTCTRERERERVEERVRMNERQRREEYKRAKNEHDDLNGGIILDTTV